MQRVLITGANGHLGTRLIRTLAGSVPMTCVVRSERAREHIGRLDVDGVDVRVLDYGDPKAMLAAATGCDVAVHLVGILKETKFATYQEAHEQTCQTLADIAVDAGIRRIVYLSIVGSAPDSPNACLASKGRAEKILEASDIPATILQVPMVLGEGDYASRALAARARRGVNFTFRAASREQPIYADDVVHAILAAAAFAQRGHFRLGGPQNLSRRDLIKQAAAACGKRTRVISLPIGLGRGIAHVLSLVSSNPPVTRAMLDVLDHDDRVDNQLAINILDLKLTPLAETLERCVVHTDSALSNKL